MAAISWASKMKSPPLGRMITWTRMPDTAASVAATVPMVGVMPPSNSAAHSSTRCAPARSAARAASVLSTQISYVRLMCFLGT